jgi:hypothetical protein
MPDTEDGFRVPARKSFPPFFRWPALKASHAAMFLGIHRMVGIKASKPSLEGGDKLCEADEIIGRAEPDAQLELDHGVAARDWGNSG